jgi:hypothetical protein
VVDDDDRIDRGLHECLGIGRKHRGSMKLRTGQGSTQYP